MVTVIHDPAVLRAESRKGKQAGKRIALVPTMGALHAGHLSLVELAKQHADVVMVSIFVNPTQFGEGEDFDDYPRPLEEDVAKLEEAGAEFAYVPAVSAMYPQGFATTVSVSEDLTNRLCGAHRPGHFDGVTTVVSKLLLQSEADVALFGEKDFQQLQVIRRMVADLNIPTEILGAPIAREVDGLAMSSRNQYLTAEERKVAPALQEVLQWAVQEMKARPEQVSEVLKQAEGRLLAAGFVSVDYVECVDPLTLMPVLSLDQPARLLAAATLGKTRLIDNIAVELS